MEPRGDSSLHILDFFIYKEVNNYGLSYVNFYSANTWDFGPLGVELKENISIAWWKKLIH